MKSCLCGLGKEKLSMLDNNFEITNTLVCDTVDINMTSLQGTIKTTYDELIKVFGHPTMTDGDPYEKVNAQWPNRVQSTIY